MDQRAEPASIEMDVVIYPDDGGWIAQGLQYDMTARGKSPTDAAKRLDAKIGAELVMSFELKDATPLAGVGQAPQRFWQMFETAEARLEINEMPVQLMDIPNAPRIVPRMRLADNVAA